MSNKETKHISKDELLQALKSDFATTVNKVYFNALDHEFGFREVTVNEQKSLSRIMISNEKRRDITYDAQCALINQIALDSDFNIYDMTEFDKIKMLMVIYQSNLFNNNVQFTCKECGTENQYALDFNNAVEQLDKLDVSDKLYKYPYKTWDFEFLISYPTVRRVSTFYKMFMRNNKVTDQNKEQIESTLNFDYINLFIKNIKMKTKDGTIVKDIELFDYNPTDVQEIIAIFPQDIIYSENGVMKFITKEFIQKINDQFEQHKCIQCGAIQEGDIDNVQSFL